MKRTIMQLILVLAVCCMALVMPVFADFTGTPPAGVAPLTVQFTDDSSNEPISWNWSFGDGSLENATFQNPVHTYTNAGTYTVSLNATNASSSNTTIRRNYITVHAPPPTVSGIAPKTNSNKTTISVTNLAGTNFTSGATVMLTPVNVNPVLKGSINLPSEVLQTSTLCLWQLCLCELF